MSIDFVASSDRELYGRLFTDKLYWFTPIYPPHGEIVSAQIYQFGSNTLVSVHSDIGGGRLEHAVLKSREPVDENAVRNSLGL